MVLASALMRGIHPLIITKMADVQSFDDELRLIRQNHREIPGKLRTSRASEKSLFCDIGFKSGLDCCNIGSCCIII